MAKVRKPLTKRRFFAPISLASPRGVARGVPEFFGTRPRGYRSNHNFVQGGSLSSAAQHVGNRVAPGSTPQREARRSQGAARKQIAARRAVRQLEPFPITKQVHGVVADDVAASHRQDAHLLLRARSTWPSRPDSSRASGRTSLTALAKRSAVPLGASTLRR